MSDFRFRLDDTWDLLSRTPKVLRLMLEDLPEHWLHCNEGENTWSAFDVLGHLIQGEKTDWIPRIQIMIKDGDEKTFEPFDRFAHLHENQHKSFSSLLDEFETIRFSNLEVAKKFVTSETDLDLTGEHPDLGTVTLRELLATWTVHDLNHISQIVRVMAKYYHHDVGPWKAYLGILQPK